MFVNSHFSYKICFNIYNIEIKFRVEWCENFIYDRPFEIRNLLTFKGGNLNDNILNTFNVLKYSQTFDRKLLNQIFNITIFGNF